MEDVYKRQVNTLLVHTFTFPVQVDAHFLESKGGKFAYSVIFSGGDNKVFGRIVLQNQPHTFHIVFGVSPVAQGIQIPQVQFILESLCDACCRQVNFPGNKSFAAIAAIPVAAVINWNSMMTNS